MSKFCLDCKQSIGSKHYIGLGDDDFSKWVCVKNKVVNDGTKYLCRKCLDELDPLFKDYVAKAATSNLQKKVFTTVCELNTEHVPLYNESGPSGRGSVSDGAIPSTSTANQEVIRSSRRQIEEDTDSQSPKSSKEKTSPSIAAILEQSDSNEQSSKGSPSRRQIEEDTDSQSPKSSKEKTSPSIAAILEQSDSDSQSSRGSEGNRRLKRYRPKDD